MVNQTKPNHTQIPNWFLDYGMQLLHSSSEFKAFLVICRKTIGWHKDTDDVSITTICKISGCNRNSAVSAIRKLIKLGLIRQHGMGKYARTFEVNYVAEKIEVVPESYQYQYRSGTSSGTEVVPSKETFKINLSKEITPNGVSPEGDENIIIKNDAVEYTKSVSEPSAKQSETEEPIAKSLLKSDVTPAAVDAELMKQWEAAIPKKGAAVFASVVSDHAQVIAYYDQLFKDAMPAGAKPDYKVGGRKIKELLSRYDRQTICDTMAAFFDDDFARKQGYRLAWLASNFEGYMAVNAPAESDDVNFAKKVLALKKRREENGR